VPTKKTLLVTEDAPECISGDANLKNFPGEAPWIILQEGFPSPERLQRAAIKLQLLC